MEQVTNMSDTEARKQVMSPIVDHFVALQADFQKQLAALRELTDNWRHEKDPPNKLGNNKSDNLYDRSDEPTVLIDTNLVPRAVQQALDVTEPSDFAITRREQATVDSRDDSKYSLNTTKPTEGLDQVDAALSTEIPVTAVDDLAKANAMDSSHVPEYSSKMDNINHSIGESSTINTDKTVVRVIESDLPKSDNQKRESDDVEMKRTARSHEETKEMHADTSTILIDETAAATEVTDSPLPERQERLSPNNARVEEFSSPGTSALDTTNNMKPGQPSSTRQETSSGPELPPDIARQSIGTENSKSLVEVGKSAELSGALGISFQNSSVPQRTDILPQQTSSRDESSIADTVNVTEKVQDASERDLSAREQSDQRVMREIPRQNDEPHVVAVEALLSAVKSLPEQFLTPFITAMQMLSPEKGDVNVTSDVQLMNRLNTLHSMNAEDPKTGASEAEIIDRTNIDTLRNSATMTVASRNDAVEEKPVSATVLENKTGSQSLPEKDQEDKRPEKGSAKLRSSKIIDKKIVRSKVPDSRTAKSRSLSVPDIKQQNLDVRSVRTDKSNISQTNIATDLTSETSSDSVDLMDKDNPEEWRTMNKAAASNVGVAEASQVDVAKEMYSRKNSLEIVDMPARSNNQEKSIGDEIVRQERSAEEMRSGESSSSHMQPLTASSTHDQSIVRKPLKLAVASGGGSTDASSSSKEAESSSEKASHEKLLADNAFVVIDPLLKSDLSQDKNSVASINDSNTKKSASQSITETNVSQKDPIVYNSNANHSSVSCEVIMNATNTQSANKQDINKRDVGQLNDSSHAHVSTSASPISSTSSPAKVPDHSLNVKSPPVEIFDNHGTTLRHDKNDTKPIVPKNAVHVSEKVEQTISVTYHTPASDDKNETTLKENVLVEQNTANDLSISQSRINENNLLLLTHSHVPPEMNLDNLRDQGKEITFVLAKSDSSMIEQTSDIQSLIDPQDVINQDKFIPTNNQEIIELSHNHLAHAKIMSPSFSKNNLEVNTCPENISLLEISNNFGAPKTSKDIKIPENNETISIPETSKSIIDESSVASINKLPDENVHDQLCELSSNNNNTPDNASPLSIEHVLSVESKKSVSYPIDRDEEPYLGDEVSQSHDNTKQDAQTSNSTTRNILHALKNLNIFFTTSTEGRNIASAVNEDSFPDPIIGNVSDVTPGISDTFEIKISESPITTVNDCAPIKNTVERETDKIENVDIIDIKKDVNSFGNEISIVARNEQVESTKLLKLTNNENSMEKNTEQVNQSRKSVIAKPVVKHRSRSPLKKIVRRKSPVKIVKKSSNAPRKNLAWKSASPYGTTVTKAKATVSEIIKRSNRTMQSNESRIKEPLKSTCNASDKRNNENKSVTKLPDKTVKQSLNNTSMQKTAGNIKVNDNKKVSASDTVKISIVNNATNSEPQTKLPIVKQYNGNKSENCKKRTFEYSKNKNIEDVENKNPGSSKNIKAEAFENQAINQAETPNDDKILIKMKKDNLKPKTFLPSKIPILMQRKVAQSTDTTLSNPSKINLNDMSLLKNVSTKLPVMSQAALKVSLKIQKKVNVSNAPTMQKIDSKDNNKLRRNQIKSSNGRAIEITENVKDKQILEENHTEENIVESEETEEPPKVKSIESELNENSQASNSGHNDPSADLSKQLEVENAIEESSDAFSSDSEYSKEDEDTGTAKYISDHNSEYNSVEEFTDAELLLEKTLNEIRSEISESEEEVCTSESEESEDVTYSYETESHDHDSTSSKGSVDERKSKSSEFEDSAEEDVYEELPSEEEETSEQVETSEQFEGSDKEADDIIHDDEANISNGTESNLQITQENEENNLKALTEAATVATELSQPEINMGINEKTLEVSQNLKIDSNAAITDSAASSTKIGQSIKFKEDIQSEANNSKKTETKREDANKIEKRDQSTVQNDTIKTLRVASHESQEKRAKIGRRASTGSKEVKIEKDDTLKGVDRARAPKKRFSLVASRIRRFEGEENAERAHVESIKRKRQGSPKTEREVSRRELPSDT